MTVILPSFFFPFFPQRLTDQPIFSVSARGQKRRLFNTEHETGVSKQTYAARGHGTAACTEASIAAC